MQQQHATPNIAIFQPTQYQSDSMNLDNTIENTMGKVLNTSHRSTPIISPTTPLSRVQKKAIKKKLKKF
ncbi:hypothetical protein RclHR1_14920003 [Rhizophagus clarus]|uniref:Uncharacterized protein n=1 Tax=Rhizophagus clarus TaxID=94130 RepID=A0A2Z6QUK4_9GLOM|nr:hypothetical protein RclHR1_14920003 [Rhizophagus clarus]